MKYRGWPVARLIRAWWRTRQLASTLHTRADLERWQNRRIAQWMTEALPRIRYYTRLGARRLEDLPIVDKSVLMADFGAFNCAGIDGETGWRIFSGKDRAPAGFHVGASTGTSGNRGLYVISDAERYEWLGVLLAKALPRYPFEGARIALVLPQVSALYSATNRAPRLSLRFFDLKAGLETLAPVVCDWKPDTLIAPPKVLRWLAERNPPAGVRRLFSGAEVLDAPDRTIIERVFKVPVREIYMATEGLLGVACEHGTIHLVEDALHFELEPVGTDGLVSPIITDFTRTTQIMARYRMNDLLRLRERPCPCGSPLRAVAEIVGRADDILLLPAIDGGRLVEVTPDILRNVILDCDGRITDFRLAQVGPDRLTLSLPEPLSDLGPGVCAAIEGLFARLGIRAMTDFDVGLPATGIAKVRRIERRWRANGGT
jgi:putative adenylate-forming enzyme